jgi:hypothetical protein
MAQLKLRPSGKAPLRTFQHRVEKPRPSGKALLLAFSTCRLFQQAVKLIPYPDPSSSAKQLFDSYGLRQVAGLVDVAASAHSDVIGEKL